MSRESERLPAWLAVSRETHAKLCLHWALVEKWTPAVNLISAASIAEGWKRHVLDSAQVWFAAPVEKGRWVDIGSGGGFPGLIAAIIAQERAPDVVFTLIESDRRKATFLAEAARQLHLSLEVRAERVNRIHDLVASVVSARALAPLAALLAEAKHLLGPSGVAVFPKGQSYQAELLDARRRWSFYCDVIPSRTDDRSVVLRIRDVLDA